MATGSSSGAMRMDLRVIGDFKSVDLEGRRSARRVQSYFNSLSLNPKGINNFNQSLGRITGKASEFQKSMDAATARVFAFGATAVVLNTVTQSFKNLLAATVNVQKRLIEVDAILNASTKEMLAFRRAIFNVAKDTGQTFETVADGAAELARQGLTAAQSADRLNNALILTRISGLDSVASVNALTAAINGYKSEALSATQIVNKLVAVDTAFAVSSKDLADGFQRAGSTAEDAKVSFNELLGIITAVQQTTARGGAVIGNALKSIFTRLNRSTTIKALQDLGVQIDASQGGIDKLRALSKALEQLNDVSKESKIKELAGGVFQINVVSAALKDLSDETSIYANATKIAADASDEAFKKNEKLATSFSSRINELIIGVTDLGSKIGEISFGPLLDSLLDTGNKLTEIFAGALDEEQGNEVIKYFFRGVSKFISGPGVAIITGAFLRILGLIRKFAADGLKEVFNLNSATQRVKEIETGIIHLLNKDAVLRADISDEALNVEQKHKLIQRAIRIENDLLLKQQKATNEIARSLYAAGIVGFKGDTGEFVQKKKVFKKVAGGNYPTAASQGQMPRDPSFYGVSFTDSTQVAQEKRRARQLGAKGPLKVFLSKGDATIGGEPFIYNSQEIVIPKFGANGDAAVIPKYIDPPKHRRLGRIFAGGSQENFVSRSYSDARRFGDLLGLGGFDLTSIGGNRSSIARSFVNQNQQNIVQGIVDNQTSSSAMSPHRDPSIRQGIDHTILNNKGWGAKLSFNKETVSGVSSIDELKAAIYSQNALNGGISKQQIPKFSSSTLNTGEQVISLSPQEIGEVQKFERAGIAARHFIITAKESLASIRKNVGQETGKDRLKIAGISKYGIAVPDKNSLGIANPASLGGSRGIATVSLLDENGEKFKEDVYWSLVSERGNKPVKSFFPNMDEPSLTKTRALLEDEFRGFAVEEAFNYSNRAFGPTSENLKASIEKNLYGEGLKGSIGSLIGGAFEAAVLSSVGLDAPSGGNRSRFFDIREITPEVGKLFVSPLGSLLKDDKQLERLELKGKGNTKNFGSFINKSLKAELDNKEKSYVDGLIASGQPLEGLSGGKLQINSIRKHGLIFPSLRGSGLENYYKNGISGNALFGYGKRVPVPYTARPNSISAFHPLADKIDDAADNFDRGILNKVADKAVDWATLYKLGGVPDKKKIISILESGDGGTQGGLASGVGAAFESAIVSRLKLESSSGGEFNNFDITGSQNLSVLRSLIGAGSYVRNFEVKGSGSKRNLQDFVKKVLNYEYKGDWRHAYFDATGKNLSKTAATSRNDARSNLSKINRLKRGVILPKDVAKNSKYGVRENIQNFAGGYIPPDVKHKEVTEARKHGAIGPIKPIMSDGTIGGQKFVMNTGEIELPNFGRNGDSAVIPNYNLHKVNLARAFKDPRLSFSTKNFNAQFELFEKYGVDDFGIVNLVKLMDKGRIPHRLVSQIDTSAFGFKLKNIAELSKAGIRPDELKALEYYTGAGYDTINRALRGQSYKGFDDEPFRQLGFGIDNLIYKAERAGLGDKSNLIYRGESKYENGIERSLNYQELLERYGTSAKKGIISGASSYKNAQKFGRVRAIEKQIGEGVKLSDILQRNDPESEVLLKSTTRFSRLLSTFPNFAQPKLPKGFSFDRLNEKNFDGASFGAVFLKHNNRKVGNVDFDDLLDEIQVRSSFLEEYSKDPFVSQSNRDADLGKIVKIGRKPEDLKAGKVTRQLRGQGFGKAMYAELIREAYMLDKALTSDKSVSSKAARVWRSFEKDGYTVGINNEHDFVGDESSGRFFSKDGKPVFHLSPRGYLPDGYNSILDEIDIGNVPNFVNVYLTKLSRLGRGRGSVRGQANAVGKRKIELDEEYFRTQSPDVINELINHEAGHNIFSARLISRMASDVKNQPYKSFYNFNSDSALAVPKAKAVSSKIKSKFFDGDFDQLVEDSGLYHRHISLNPLEKNVYHGPIAVTDEILRQIEGRMANGRGMSQVQKKFVDSLISKGFVNPKYHENLKKNYGPNSRLQRALNNKIKAFAPKDSEATKQILNLLNVSDPDGVARNVFLNKFKKSYAGADIEDINRVLNDSISKGYVREYDGFLVPLIESLDLPSLAGEIPSFARKPFFGVLDDLRRGQPKGRGLPKGKYKINFGSSGNLIFDEDDLGDLSRFSGGKRKLDEDFPRIRQRPELGLFQRGPASQVISVRGREDELLDLPTYQRLKTRGGLQDEDSADFILDSQGGIRAALEEPTFLRQKRGDAIELSSEARSQLQQKRDKRARISKLLDEQDPARNPYLSSEYLEDAIYARYHSGRGGPVLSYKYPSNRPTNRKRPEDKVTLTSTKNLSDKELAALGIKRDVDELSVFLNSTNNLSNDELIALGLKPKPLPQKFELDDIDRLMTQLAEDVPTIKPVRLTKSESIVEGLHVFDQIRGNSGNKKFNLDDLLDDLTVKKTKLANIAPKPVLKQPAGSIDLNSTAPDLPKQLEKINGIGPAFAKEIYQQRHVLTNKNLEGRLPERVAKALRENQNRLFFSGNAAKERELERKQIGTTAPNKEEIEALKRFELEERGLLGGELSPNIVGRNVYNPNSSIDGFVAGIKGQGIAGIGQKRIKQLKEYAAKSSKREPFESAKDISDALGGTKYARELVRKMSPYLPENLKPTKNFAGGHFPNYAIKFLDKNLKLLDSKQVFRAGVRGRHTSEFGSERHRGIIDSDILQRYIDNRNPLVLAAMDKAGVKNASEYNDYLSNEAARLRKAGELNRFNLVTGPVGSGKTHFAKGGSLGKVARAKGIRRKVTSIVLPEQLRQMDEIITTRTADKAVKLLQDSAPTPFIDKNGNKINLPNVSSIEGRGGAFLDQLDRIHILSTRKGGEAVDELYNRRNFRETTGIGKEFRGHNSGIGASVDTTNIEGAIALSIQEGRFAKNKVSVLDIKKNFGLGRGGPIKFAGEQKIALNLGSYSPFTKGHQNLVAESVKAGYDPENIFLAVARSSSSSSLKPETLKKLENKEALTEQESQTYRSILFDQNLRINAAKYSSSGANVIRGQNITKGNGGVGTPPFLRREDGTIVMPAKAGNLYVTGADRANTGISKRAVEDERFDLLVLNRSDGISGTEARDILLGAQKPSAEQLEKVFGGNVGFWTDTHSDGTTNLDAIRNRAAQLPFLIREERRELELRRKPIQDEIDELSDLTKRPIQKGVSSRWLDERGHYSGWTEKNPRRIDYADEARLYDDAVRRLNAIKPRTDREIIKNWEDENPTGRRIEIPNYSDPIRDAIKRETTGTGVRPDQVRIDSHPILKKFNPYGIGVTNTRDQKGGKLSSVSHQDLRAGRHVYPSFADEDFDLKNIAFTLDTDTNVIKDNNGNIITDPNVYKAFGIEPPSNKTKKVTVRSEPSPESSGGSSEGSSSGSSPKKKKNKKSKAEKEAERILEREDRLRDAEKNRGFRTEGDLRSPRGIGGLGLGLGIAGSFLLPAIEPFFAQNNESAKEVEKLNKQLTQLALELDNVNRAVEPDKFKNLSQQLKIVQKQQEIAARQAEEYASNIAIATSIGLAGLTFSEQLSYLFTGGNKPKNKSNKVFGLSSEGLGDKINKTRAGKITALGLGSIGRERKVDPETGRVLKNVAPKTKTSRLKLGQSRIKGIADAALPAAALVAATTAAIGTAIAQPYIENSSLANVFDATDGKTFGFQEGRGGAAGFLLKDLYDFLAPVTTGMTGDELVKFEKNLVKANEQLNNIQFDKDGKPTGKDSRAVLNSKGEVVDFKETDNAKELARELSKSIERVENRVNRLNASKAIFDSLNLDTTRRVSKLTVGQSSKEDVAFQQIDINSLENRLDLSSQLSRFKAPEDFSDVEDIRREQLNTEKQGVELLKIQAKEQLNLSTKLPDVNRSDLDKVVNNLRTLILADRFKRSVNGNLLRDETGGFQKNNDSFFESIRDSRKRIANRIRNEISLEGITGEENIRKTFEARFARQTVDLEKVVTEQDNKKFLALFDQDRSTVNGKSVVRERILPSRGGDAKDDIILAVLKEAREIRDLNKLTKLDQGRVDTANRVNEVTSLLDSISSDGTVDRSEFKKFNEAIKKLQDDGVEIENLDVFVSRIQDYFKGLVDFQKKEIVSNRELFEAEKAENKRFLESYKSTIQGSVDRFRNLRDNKTTVSNDPFSKENEETFNNLGLGPEAQTTLRTRLLNDQGFIANDFLKPKVKPIKQVPKTKRQALIDSFEKNPLETFDGIIKRNEEFLKDESKLNIRGRDLGNSRKRDTRLDKFLKDKLDTPIENYTSFLSELSTFVPNNEQILELKGFQRGGRLVDAKKIDEKQKNDLLFNKTLNRQSNFLSEEDKFNLSGRSIGTNRARDKGLDEFIKQNVGKPIKDFDAFNEKLNSFIPNRGQIAELKNLRASGQLASDLPAEKKPKNNFKFGDETLERFRVAANLTNKTLKTDDFGKVLFSDGIKKTFQDLNFGDIDSNLASLNLPADSRLNKLNSQFKKLKDAQGVTDFQTGLSTFEQFGQAGQQLINNTSSENRGQVTEVIRSIMTQMFATLKQGADGALSGGLNNVAQSIEARNAEKEKKLSERESIAGPEEITEEARRRNESTKGNKETFVDTDDLSKTLSDKFVSASKPIYDELDKFKTEFNKMSTFLSESGVSLETTAQALKRVEGAIKTETLASIFDKLEKLAAQVQVDKADLKNQQAEFEKNKDKGTVAAPQVGGHPDQD